MNAAAPQAATAAAIAAFKPGLVIPRSRIDRPFALMTRALSEPQVAGQAVCGVSKVAATFGAMGLFVLGSRNRKAR